MQLDAADLYQEVILDHSRSPRNFRRPERVTHEAEGYNPLCGDHFHVYLEMDGDRIRKIGFEGAGCAISKASASMMTAALAGKTRQQAEALMALFRGVITGREPPPGDGALGKLMVFEGVRAHPSRVKCAALAWHTLKAAMEGHSEATTE